MRPALKDGDYVLVVKQPSFIKPSVGAVYGFNHNSLGLMVKRLVRFDKNILWFKGDNKESLSSDEIGKFKWSKKQPLYRIIFRI